MVRKLTVEETLKHNAVIIDTRTPQEFELDHIPEAINLPILSNEERVIVGTIYKQVSQEEAIQKGIEFFSKKLPDFMQKISPFKKEEIIVYCWRGGMRSRSVASLLESLGFNVYQLEGGYRFYRNYIREHLYNFKLKPKLVLFWGLTCTGKTKLLHKFSNHLDLEGLAQHRGSMFGAVGLKPRSQKNFENLLYWRLQELNKEKIIFAEGESRRIGDLMIPEFLWKKMRVGINVLIKRSLPLRAKAGVEEYFSDKSDLEEIRKITLSLPKLLSKKRKEEIAELIEKNNLEEAAKILLEEYYDPLYSHTLKQLKFKFEINNDDTEKAVKVIKRKIFSLSS